MCTGHASLWLHDLSDHQSRGVAISCFCPVSQSPRSGRSGTPELNLSGLWFWRGRTIASKCDCLPLIKFAVIQIFEIGICLVVVLMPFDLTQTAFSSSMFGSSYESDRYLDVYKSFIWGQSCCDLNYYSECCSVDRREFCDPPLCKLSGHCFSWHKVELLMLLNNEPAAASTLGAGLVYEDPN